MDKNIKVKNLMLTVAFILFGVLFYNATEGYLMGNFNGNGYLRVAGATKTTFAAGDTSAQVPGAPFETLYYKASSSTNADTILKEVLMPDGTWFKADCLFISSSSTDWKGWNITASEQYIGDILRYSYMNGASTSLQFVRQAFSDTKQ